MKLLHKSFGLILLYIVLLLGCGTQENQQQQKVQDTEALDDFQVDVEPEEDFDEIDELVSELSIEQKVAQLFIVTPEALTGYETVTAAGDTTKAAIENYPVGGLIYFSQNIVDETQLKSMLANTSFYYNQAGAISPFLTIDEEGGTVARIGNNSSFDVVRFPNMTTIGSSKNTDKAYDVGQTIGSYLSGYGFNMDMAPVADILSNPSNTVIGKRSFGSDAALVADMVAAECLGFYDTGIIPVIKHFPGHGDTAADSHKGYAYTDKTLDELLSCELIPFQQSIDEGVPAIMVGHISVPNVTEDDTPSSLSHYMITDLLRKQMGFEGVVITDAMNMGAITTEYSSREAAVAAINAGADIILMPQSFNEAYTGILSAVQSGDISEERIDESVYRILKLKHEYLLWITQ